MHVLVNQACQSAAVLTLSRRWYNNTSHVDGRVACASIVM